ncbi:MAG: hypothetical protein ACT4P9_03030 [Betaproteobacteria bacterium]
MTSDPSVNARPENDRVAVDAAMAVLDAHVAALNARDEKALAATLHFPHYRLSGGRMKIWERPNSYFADFRARAGADWHHTKWTSRTVVAATADKVHLDVQFTRYRADDSAIGTFRALWVVAKLDGRWAAQARSSFAA